MKIVYASNTFVDPTARNWESNFGVNGQRASEVIPCPDALKPFLRDGRNLTQILTFKTQLVFASHVLAQVAQLCAFPLYPGSGPVTITCGEGSDTPQDCYSANALLTGYNIVERIGLRLLLEIQLTCQPFTTSIPPGFVNPNTMRFVRTLPVTNGATSFDWTYPSTFGSGHTPTVFAELSPANDTDPFIDAKPRNSSTDENHSVIGFGAPVPNANYVINLSAEYQP